MVLADLGMFRQIVQRYKHYRLQTRTVGLMMLHLNERYCSGQIFLFLCLRLKWLQAKQTREGQYTRESYESSEPSV